MPAISTENTNACPTALEEVVARASTACWDVSLVVGDRREDAELWTEVLVYGHDGGDVAASVAVVWS
jgi:hypothetical protein